MEFEPKNSMNLFNRQTNRADLFKNLLQKFYRKFIKDHIFHSPINLGPAEPRYTLLFANSVDLDQLASLKKPTDLDLHCSSFSI